MLSCFNILNHHPLNLRRPQLVVLRHRHLPFPFLPVNILSSFSIVRQNSSTRQIAGTGRGVVLISFLDGPYSFVFDRGKQYLITTTGTYTQSVLVVLQGSSMLLLGFIDVLKFLKLINSCVFRKTECHKRASQCDEASYTDYHSTDESF